MWVEPRSLSGWHKQVNTTACLGCNTTGHVYHGHVLAKWVPMSLKRPTVLGDNASDLVQQHSALSVEIAARLTFQNKYRFAIAQLCLTRKPTRWHLLNATGVDGVISSSNLYSFSRFTNPLTIIVLICAEFFHISSRYCSIISVAITSWNTY